MEKKRWHKCIIAEGDYSEGDEINLEESETVFVLFEKSYDFLITELVDVNSISNSPELPHIFTTDPPLKILIDSGASSSVTNPEIAYELFSDYIFPYDFEIKSVHNKTRGTHALTFPILNEFGDDTPITFLIAPWHSTYDCLIGHKDLEKLEANINYKTRLSIKVRVALIFQTA